MNKILIYLFSFIISAQLVFAQQSLIHHNIEADVQPSSSSIEVIDEISIPDRLLSENLKTSRGNGLPQA